MPRHIIGAKSQPKGPNPERRNVIASAKKRQGDALLKQMEDIIANGRRTGITPKQLLAEIERKIKAQEKVEKKIEKAENSSKTGQQLLDEIDAILKSQGG